MKLPPPPTPESNPLFLGVQKDEVSAFLARGKHHHLAPHHVLIHQGSIPESIHLQLNGFGRNHLVTQDGKEVTLMFTLPGEWLGVPMLFSNSPHPIQISSQTELEVLSFLTADLRSFVRQHPLCMEWILHHAMILAQQIISVFVQGHHESPRLRLAKRLTEVTDYLGVPAEFPCSQADLGMWCGLSRQSVAKVLAEWEQAGIVETGYGTLKILEAQPLLDIIGRGR